MASKKNKSLYDLVQTLSAVEKRYLQNYWLRHEQQRGKANLLLAAFAGEMEPNEAELRALYAKEGYQSQYLAADRYHLYEEVLEGLAALRSQSISEVKISRMLQKARILFDKAQIQAALDYVLAGLEACEAQEHWGLALAFVPLWQNCLRILGQTAALGQSLAQQAQYAQALAQAAQWLYWHSQSMDFRRQLGKVRAAEALAPFEALLAELEAFKQEAMAGQFYPQFHYLEIYANYYFVKDDLAAEYQTNLQLLSLMQAHPWYLDDKPLNYIVVQTRLLILGRRLAPERFLANLQEYRQLSQQSNRQSQEIAATIFIFSYNYEIEHYLSHQQYASAFALVPEMQKGLKRYQKQFSPDLALSAYYRMGVAAIFVRQPAKALDYLNLVIQQFDPALRPELHRMSLILLALCHQQLGHHKLVPALIAQARDHSRKQKALYQSEALVLRCLAQLAKTATGTQLRQALMKLDKNLEKLVGDKLESKSFQVFNFRDWIHLELQFLP